MKNYFYISLNAPMETFKNSDYENKIENFRIIS